MKDWLSHIDSYILEYIQIIAFILFSYLSNHVWQRWRDGRMNRKAWKLHQTEMTLKSRRKQILQPTQVSQDNLITERRKSVSFCPANNLTRIFHKKDTPISIARNFKKPCEDKAGGLKPILRHSSSTEDFQ